jgi:hypothetical protein
LPKDAAKGRYVTSVLQSKSPTWLPKDAVARVEIGQDGGHRLEMADACPKATTAVSDTGSVTQYYEQYENATLCYGDVTLNMRFVSKLAPTDALALLDGTDITGQKLWRGALVLNRCAWPYPASSLCASLHSFGVPLCKGRHHTRLFSFLAHEAKLPSGVRIIELGCGSAVPITVVLLPAVMSAWVASQAQAHAASWQLVSSRRTPWH